MRSRLGKFFLQEAEKYRPFLLPALIVIAILFSSLLVLRPKISDVLAGQKALLLQKERLAQLTQKLTILEGLSEDELSEKTKRLIKILPTEKDPPGALGAVRRLTQAAGVELGEAEMEPGEMATESVQGLSFLSLQVVIRGSGEAIREFLGKVKSVAPLMRVEKMVMAQKEEENEARLNLNVFYLPAPEVLGPIEEPLPEIDPQENKAYQSFTLVEVPEAETVFVPVESGKENPFSF